MSPPDADKVFGYAFEQIYAHYLERLKKEKTITAKEVRRLFECVLDSQSDYNLTGLSRVLMGSFHVNVIYWPSAEKTPLAEHLDNMAFYAIARHSASCLNDESYVYVLWPLMSQRVYIVPFELVKMMSYPKSWADRSSQYLNDTEEHTEVNGHPFSATRMLLREYQIHRKGPIKKRVISIEFIRDIAHYFGSYDDIDGGVWERTVEYPTFWFDEHQKDIPLLNDSDIPDYDKHKETVFSNGC